MAPTRGRGAASRVAGRFETREVRGEDDGWGSVYAGIDDGAVAAHAPVTVERARSIISRNQSPDIAFSQSVNPYRGCEHGCVYCFARPSHAYLDLSPGLDFETRLFAKTNAPELLRKEFSRKAWLRPRPDRAGHQHRRLAADRAPPRDQPGLPGSLAGGAASGEHRHQGQR
jgi:hypothetical protein